MVNVTGENLKVLIITNIGEDWQTFSTWYSIHKNLPDASVLIACERTKKIEFQLLQWAKRLKIPHFYFNHFSDDSVFNWLHAVYLASQSKTLEGHLLVVNSRTMILDVLNDDLLQLFNRPDSVIVNDFVWYLAQKKEQLIRNVDEYGLTGQGSSAWDYTTCISHEAKEREEVFPIVTYNKGCGNWIDTMHGCPFSSASGMVAETVTVNEMRIIELWRRMVSLYSAVH